MKKRVFLALIVVLWPYFARADSTSSLRADSIDSLRADCSSAPNVGAWTVMNKSRIEVRISESSVAYLGLDIEYRNPADTYEFVRVISRHVPLVWSVQVQKDERLAVNMATNLYNQKAERDLLDKLESEIDPVLYVQWRIKEDALTGRQFLDGDVNIWLVLPSGDCHLAKNKSIQVEFLSENVGNGKPHNVLIGRKYEVDGYYHIIKADTNDVKKLVTGEK